MSSNEEFPLKNKQAAVDIKGVHTEILLTGFADKIFVVITQYGKIGSLVKKKEKKIKREILVDSFVMYV